ncbi:hypothetical protein N7501_010900 [Penicillium viridicatum]|nr:hypothetical protein N7501_010900 [Penicillium viridicatum]
MERTCIGHHMNCQDPRRPRERERIRKIYWTSREPIVLDDFWSRPHDPGGSAQKPLPSQGSAKRLGLVDTGEGNLTLIHPMAFLVDTLISTSIIGLVVEFVVAIDEARVRFTDDALPFFCLHLLLVEYLRSIFISIFFDTNRLSNNANSLIYYPLPKIHPGYISLEASSTQLTIIIILINSKLEYIPHRQH